MKLTSLNPQRYLVVKIFAWFWLTLALTIFLLFIFSNVTDDWVEHEALKGPHLKNLQQLAKGVERASQKRPDKTVHQLLSHPRLAQHKLLFVSSELDSIGFFNRDKIPDIDVNQLAFSRNLAPQRIITPKFFAKGPVKLALANETFLLYEIEPWHRPPFGFKIMMMPNWLKILLILGGSIALSFVFATLLMRPIKSLQQGTKALANGELSTRINHNDKHPDELSSLAISFNAMAEQLELLMTSQKRLLADVSHELRSPLTRLQMATALAQMKANPEIGDYLTRIENEANNLEAMIGDVLKLARLESHSQLFDPQPIALTSITKSLIDNATFEADQLGKKVMANDYADIIITADAVLLASAIENLIRNAVKHAISLVEITISHTSTCLTLLITDDGLGVSDEHLGRLCEPFYRASDSRERNTGGAGLGLAIAKHAIELHGGILTLSSELNNGFRAQINLPINNEHN